MGNIGWGANPQTGLYGPTPTPAPNTSGMSNDPVHDAAGRPTPTTADNVKAMQQFLVNRGYKITVDGIRGPETNAAVLAFHKRVDPKAFNKQNAPTPPASTAPVPKAGSGAGGPKGKTPAGKTPPVSNPVNAPATSDQIIDPAAYASGAVNAQYNPQITALLQQIKQGNANETSHTSQIQDWFNNALQQAQANATENADSGTYAQNAYDAANQNVLNLFGGPNANGSTAAEAAAFHDIAAGQLGSDINAQNAFDKNIKSITALQGAEAQRNQLNTDQTNVNNLASQLIALRGAKGQAYNAAYQQGVQNKTQQEAAIQQLKLAQAEFPFQVQSAQASAKSATAQASVAGAQAKASLAIAKANLAKANAATKLALSGGGGSWNLTQPAQQGALQKALETNVLGPKGALSLQPDIAWANLQQQLQMNGLGNDPTAQKLAQGVFLQGLWSAHSNGNFGGWAWNGKKLVQTGNKYAIDKKSGQRVLVNSKGKIIPDYKPHR